MAKSPDQRITPVREDKHHADGITPLPDHQAEPPVDRKPVPVSFGSRLALLAIFAGIGLLVLQLLSEPLQALLHSIGLLH